MTAILTALPKSPVDSAALSGQSAPSVPPTTLSDGSEAAESAGSFHDALHQASGQHRRDDSDDHSGRSDDSAHSDEKSSGTAAAARGSTQRGSANSASATAAGDRPRHGHPDPTNSDPTNSDPTDTGAASATTLPADQSALAAIAGLVTSAASTVPTSPAAPVAATAAAADPNEIDSIAAAGPSPAPAPASGPKTATTLAGPAVVGAPVAGTATPAGPPSAPGAADPTVPTIPASVDPATSTPTGASANTAVALVVTPAGAESAPTQPVVADAAASVVPTASGRRGSATTTNANADYSSVAAAVSTAPTTASTPLATTAPSAAPRADGLSAQPGLAAAFATLRTAPNGSVSLNVALHPADLGAVQVHATFHDGTLNVTVACADDAARQAVTAALPDLREQLGHAAQIDVHIGDGALSQNSGGGQASPDGQVVDYGQRGPTRSSGGDSHAPPDPSNSRRPDGGGDRGLDRWM